VAAAWPAEPLRVRHRLRRPWWLPLLIPAFLFVGALIGAFKGKTHVVKHDPFGTIVGWVLILLLVGAPCFFAGIRFIRHALSDSNSGTADP
jgi:hypothetical protein